jgi:hypothetical protein
MSSANVDSAIVCEEANSEPKACSPEKSTAFGDSPAASARAIAKPPTTSPAAIVGKKTCWSTRRLDQRASSRTAKTPVAAMMESAIVQAKSPRPGPPNEGSGRLSAQAAVLNSSGRLPGRGRRARAGARSRTRSAPLRAQPTDATTRREPCRSRDVWGDRCIRQPRARAQLRESTTTPPTRPSRSMLRGRAARGTGDFESGRLDQPPRQVRSQLRHSTRAGRRLPSAPSRPRGGSGRSAEPAGVSGAHRCAPLTLL